MKKENPFKENAREEIRAMIDDLEKKGKRRLPSEQQLSSQLQISRETLRSILNVFEYEGRIFRIHGSGTFINPYDSSAGLVYPCEDYSIVIRKCGFRDAVQVLPYVKIRASRKIKNMLQFSGSFTTCIPLLMLADGNVCILILYYFDPAVVKKPPVDYFGDDSHSILQMMDEVAGMRGTKLLWDDLEMYALSSDHLPAKFRPCFGDHLPASFFMQDSLFFDTESYPVCYSQSFIDTTTIHFHMIRKWR